jgi:hypothetical protein
MSPFKPIPGYVVQSFSTGGPARLYQNLNPAAAIPVDSDQVFRLKEFYNHHYRLNRGRERAQYVPNSRYVFVKMADGDTLMHPRYRHPALASGKRSSITAGWSGGAMQAGTTARTPRTPRRPGCP